MIYTDFRGWTIRQGQNQYYAQCAPHYCLYDGEMVETILLTISQYYKMELQIDAALSCIPCCHQYSIHSKMPSKYINSI